MSLEFKLSNENLINNVRTDDAQEAFNNAVNNGQTRLSLDILVELLNGLIDHVNDLSMKIDSIQSFDKADFTSKTKGKSTKTTEEQVVEV
jgi:hypothetical protein